MLWLDKQAHIVAQKTNALAYEMYALAQEV